MIAAPGDTSTEALRQQLLLRALWRHAAPGDLADWLRDGPPVERGLQAYRAHAGALAERALGAAFPTVAQLVGADGFAALARAFWHAEPPQCGDIAQWGAALPDFIAADPQLADVPYLADAARLDWAVHMAEQAADIGAVGSGLALLRSCEPAALWLRLAPGTALLASAWPVVTLWRAHRGTDAPGDDRLAPARAALAVGHGETALVRRQGWAAAVDAVDAGPARFVGALLGGQPLSRALDAAGADFDFEAWLIGALRSGLLAGVGTTGAGGA